MKSTKGICARQRKEPVRSRSFSSAAKTAPQRRPGRAQAVCALYVRNRSRHAPLMTPMDGTSACRVEIRMRGTAAASQECCRRYFPMRAATIHSQVHQMPRSGRARRSTARPLYDSTVVLSCMALRLFDSSTTVMLFFTAARSSSAAGHTRTVWPAAWERPARAWDARRPRDCMCACVACARVFCGAEAASAYDYR